MYRISLGRLLLIVALASAMIPASAHLPFDLPAPGPSFEQAAPLPSPETTWEIYGVLDRPGQVDFVRLGDLDNDLNITLLMQTFTRLVYDAYAPSMALVGPGLPVPPEALPFALPAGYGAVVRKFEGDPSSREIAGAGDQFFRVGQYIEVPDLTGGPVYLAVWDAKGRTGEYCVVYNISPDTHEEPPEFEEIYTDPVIGDGNDDGQVDVADAILVLRAIVGLVPATARMHRSLDVSPPKPDAKVMQGDGRLDILDAIRILRRTVGLDEDPFP